MAELMGFMHFNDFNDDIVTEWNSDGEQCIASGVAHSDGDTPDMPIATIAMDGRKCVPESGSEIAGKKIQPIEQLSSNFSQL